VRHGRRFWQSPGICTNNIGQDDPFAIFDGRGVFKKIVVRSMMRINWRDKTEVTLAKTKNDDAKRPIAFRELAASLRTAIRRGEYDDGVPLPTEEYLARTHGLSRQTVRRALQELVAENLVYRVAGKGTFVLSKRNRFISDFDSVSDLLTISPETTTEIVSPPTPKLDPRNARLLQLTDDRVVSLTLLRTWNGITFGLTEIFLPLELGQLLTGLEERLSQAGGVFTVISLIEELRPGLLDFTEQTVTAILPPQRILKQLKLPRESPLLRIERTYYDHDGKPLELAVSYFNPELYTYRVRLRREVR
jgi:DNA-binding GntR family transcriptional regulator